MTVWWRVCGHTTRNRVLQFVGAFICMLDGDMSHQCPLLVVVIIIGIVMSPPGMSAWHAIMTVGYAGVQVFSPPNQASNYSNVCL